MTPSGGIDSPEKTGLIGQHFTDGLDPLGGINWTTRTARAGDFVQEDVEAPDFWSDMAVGITAKLYFATVDGERESSVRTMIGRVANKITFEGVRHGYFENPSDLPLENAMSWWNGEAAVFKNELCYLLVHQMAAFNTPVWLNVGVPGRKQCCSACFLLGVEDTMLGERFGGKGDHSIMDWVATEAAIFKMGAGSGINLSNLRGSMEPLSTGGLASGPTSYMRGADAFAGTLKSGGAHRRAAKMVILDIDHPDIRDFIDCKRREDRRMKTLADAGIEINPFTTSGEKTIAEVTSFQNENISVGASDDFMRRALESLPAPWWELKARKDGKTVEMLDAGHLLDDIADAAWECGDPGIVFLDTVNAWHTTPTLRGKASPITTCNPCAETWLNDDSSCNLASLNLMKFMAGFVGGIAQPLQLDVKSFRAAIDIMVLAMDITCSFSELPTPYIEANTRDLRQLGLGYANLGATLMAKGLPYDSDEARDWAASVTALMTGRAYRRSAELASVMGAYQCFEENRGAHLGVIDKHIDALGVPRDISLEPAGPIWDEAVTDWAQARTMGEEHGYRNSQATVIAPTGTISYLMGCDTTGLEPSFSLVQHKGLAGGGSVKLINKSIGRALEQLGYKDDYREQLIDHLEKHEYLPTAPSENWQQAILKIEHADVFATANEISPDGHLSMVAAIQPFISGAPSKTINLPNSATREDIRGIYAKAWESGCKAVSVYRDGSKATQVLTSKPKEKSAFPSIEKLKDTIELIESVAPETQSIIKLDVGPAPAQPLPPEPARDRLPAERQSITHKFSIGGHEGYITAGMYDGGRLGEFFATGIGKEGSFLQGMMGSWSIACSIAFQLNPGAFETLARKYVGMEFEPRGETKNPDVPYAKSFPDYVFRWLVLRFGDVDLQEELGVLSPEVKARMTARLDANEALQFKPATMDPTIRKEMFDPIANAKAALAIFGNGHVDLSGSRPCTCGGLMTRSGTCYTCQSCGTNTGCG